MCDVHEAMAFRVVTAICRGKYSAQETTKIASDILSRATDVQMLTGIRLDPHDDVQCFAENQAAGLHDFSHVPPVAAHEVDSAISRYAAGIPQSAYQEVDIFRRRHFA